jgi:hypothetical protein
MVSKSNNFFVVVLLIKQESIFTQYANLEAIQHMCYNQMLSLIIKMNK